MGPFLRDRNPTYLISCLSFLKFFYQREMKSIM